MKNPFRKLVAAFVAWQLAFSIFASSSGPGGVDLSFDPQGGPDGDVYCAAIESDGKVVIGGAFTNFNGVSRNRIARLNTDGHLDESFDPGGGANDFVVCIVPGPDGKILIGGQFSSVNGVARPQVARLNSNGSLDMSFSPDISAGEVLSLAVQPDGKVIVAGAFHSVYRLNTDGNLDETFNSGSGANSVIYATALERDGKILVAGAFSAFNSAPRSRIARLNSDGSLDDTFFPGVGPNAEVLTMAVQPDGKPVIGGDFTLYSQKSRNHIARLNLDGTPDAFYPAAGPNGSIVSVALQRDGKVLIGGAFTSVNTQPRNRIARLLSTGTVDASFDPGSGADGLVRAVALTGDEKVVIAGSFTAVNEISRPHVARLLGDPMPSLNITPTGGNVVISWPTNAAGYTLQSAPSLMPPAIWTDLSNSPAIVGFQYAVTNPATGVLQFYRLRK